MHIPARGENIVAYANTFGCEVEEAWEWVNEYVNFPGRYPAMIANGSFEGTEKERAVSIMAYIKSQLKGSISSRIKSEVRKEREVNAVSEG